MSVLEPSSQEDIDGRVFYTTKQAAILLKVTVRTVQKWADNGTLHAEKTNGGHRRITARSVHGLLSERVSPLALSSSAASDHTREAAHRPGQSFSQKPVRLKVVAIDDDGTMLRLFRLVFDSWAMPIDLTTASNAVEGLLSIGRVAPDVVITDIVMPKIDGFHLVSTLAKTFYGHGVEIILISGLAPDEVERFGSMPEGVRFFQKPIPFGDLRKVFEGILEQLHNAGAL